MKTDKCSAIWWNNPLVHMLLYQILKFSALNAKIWILLVFALQLTSIHKIFIIPSSYLNTNLPSSVRTLQWKLQFLKIFDGRIYDKYFDIQAILKWICFTWLMICSEFFIQITNHKSQTHHTTQHRSLHWSSIMHNTFSQLQAR